MHRKIREFRVKSDAAELAFVYFAGHGVESGGENYLLPVDAKIAHEKNLSSEAIMLRSVQDAIERATVRIVILDACRVNPLADNMTRDPYVTRSVERGLALGVENLKRKSNKGYYLIGYSAAPGTTARDGQGAHSPYAEALLKHLPSPGLDIRTVLDSVRETVRVSTAGEQLPEYRASLPPRTVNLVPPQQQVIKVAPQQQEGKKATPVPTRYKPEVRPPAPQPQRTSPPPVP